MRSAPMLDLLYEDNHLLVVNKPADVPTQGAAEGEDSMVARAKDYLKRKYTKPGNVFLGVVSRLDALVTGALVMARTSKAAARLSEQFRNSEVKKIYWAVVAGKPNQHSARLIDWLQKDESRQRMVVVSDQAAAAAARSSIQQASLEYRELVRLTANFTLLEVRLETGRKHQIRVQLSHAGLPIFGDRKYGHSDTFEGIALHARRLEIVHPTTKAPLRFSAPIPKSWLAFGVQEEKAIEWDEKSSS